MQKKFMPTSRIKVSSRCYDSIEVYCYSYSANSSARLVYVGLRVISIVRMQSRIFHLFWLSKTVLELLENTKLVASLGMGFL